LGKSVALFTQTYFFDFRHWALVFGQKEIFGKSKVLAKNLNGLNFVQKSKYKIEFGHK